MKTGLGASMFSLDRNGRENGHHEWKLRRMRIVTIQTMVSESSSAFQVPMAAHSAMRPVSVIAGLGAVALGAKLHRVLKRNRSAIRQPESVVIAGVMTAQARDAAMRKSHSLVEFTQ